MRPIGWICDRVTLGWGPIAPATPRVSELCRRYLSIVIDGITTGRTTGALLGSSPTWGEQTVRWIPER